MLKNANTGFGLDPSIVYIPTAPTYPVRFTQHRKLPKEEVRIPWYSISTIKNMPIPNFIGDRYDFRSSVMGPGDLMILPGVVGIGTNVKVPIVPKPLPPNKQKPAWTLEGFYKGKQDMYEIFIDDPRTVKSTFPCSTIGIKY